MVLSIFIFAGCLGSRSEVHRESTHRESETDARERQIVEERAEKNESIPATPEKSSRSLTRASKESEPALVELGNLMRVGDEKAALQAISKLPHDARDDPRTRYLEARILENQQRFSEASDALDFDLTVLPGNISQEALMRKLSLLVRANRCTEALALLKNGISSSFQSGDEITFLTAKCSMLIGDYQEAAKGFGKLSKKRNSKVDSFENNYLFAQALSKTGDTEEAKKILRNLLISRPENSKASDIAKQLEELGGEIQFSTSEKLKRAKRLLYRRQFMKAVAELDEKSQPTKRAQLALWLHIKGMALFRERHHYEEAAKVLALAAKQKGAFAVDDEFHAARALSRVDQDDEAIASYLRLVKKYPTHKRAAQAEYLAAWLDIRHGRSRGERRMKSFLKGPRASLSEEYQREATWHLGFQAFEKGRYPLAVNYLHQYARTGRKGLVKGRGLYWKARALEAMGKKKKAFDVYRSAIRVEPLHWYALLSRQRIEGLGENLSKSPFSKQKRMTKARAPLPKIILPAEVAFYSLLGLDEDAEGALRRNEKQILSQAPRGRSLEALAKAYALIESTRRAFRIALREADELNLPLDSTNEWIWYAAYPRPHLSEVKLFAGKAGIEPAHVYATMRQESGYRPRVVSRADAIGLLQILPATAKGSAKKLGVQFSRHLLFDPNWNIRFGIEEIASVYGMFDQNLPLTIAGYNAGPQRVRRWLKETGEIETDRFVERIPFNETRNYVRRVMSHYARYKYIESPSTGWPHVVIPARVGESSNSL